jgi:hypothetical protein
VSAKERWRRVERTYAASIDSCRPVPATSTLKWVGSFGFIEEVEGEELMKRFYSPHPRYALAQWLKTAVSVLGTPAAALVFLLKRLQPSPSTSPRPPSRLSYSTMAPPGQRGEAKGQSRGLPQLSQRLPSS